MERIDAYPLLVPIGDAEYIKKGQWMRFKGHGDVSAKSVRGGPGGKIRNYFLAAPVLSAKSPGEFGND